MGPKIEMFTSTQVIELLKKNEERSLRSFFNDQLNRVDEKVDKLIAENALLKRDVEDLKTKVQDQAQIKKDIEDLKTSMNFQGQKTSEKEKNLDEEIKKFNGKETQLKEQMAELEDRNRRNNLRFEGITEEENESWERSEELVKEMIKGTLGIQEEFVIERAHRSGRPRGDWRRTIVAKMLNYKDKEKILSAYRSQGLWKNKIYINEDFSRHTMLKRKELFARAKELKEKGITAKVIYNRLVVDRAVDNVENNEIVVNLK